MKVLNIGKVVWRVPRAGGTVVKDWVCMRRIDHGPNPQDAELGVLCWGKGGDRWQASDDWYATSVEARR